MFTKQLRLLTFNLRTSLAEGDGPNYWKKRKDYVLETILDSKPDFAALQETSPDMWEDLEPHLGAWQIVKGWAEQGPKATGVGLLIRRPFRLHATGQFWLSDTPNVEESITFKHDWGPRIVLWAQIEGNPPYGLFYAMATHFDTNPESWLPTSKVALEQINQIAGYSHPTWLMGDFNCPGGCPAWQHLADDYFEDAWLKTGQGEEGTYTYHKFSGKNETHEGRIDWILYRCNGHHPWKATSCTIDRRNKNGFYPSDHFPVSATYELIE